MSSLFDAFFALIASTFRTRAALQAEILALRHQLAVLQKNAPRRLRLHRCDRLLWVVLYRCWSGWRRCLEMVQPDTVLRWHRRAFAWHWTRKSRRLPGRPEVAANIRDLIRSMSQANPLWGAPRIHGELLKLGIAVAQSTVARYLPRHRKPPSQTWRPSWRIIWRRPRPSIFSPCRQRPFGSCSSSSCYRMSDAGCCTSG
jgi:putative transposase